MKKIIRNCALTVLLVFTSSQSFGGVDCSVKPDSSKVTFIGGPTGLAPTALEIATTKTALEEWTVTCEREHSHDSLIIISEGLFQQSGSLFIGAA